MFLLLRPFRRKIIKKRKIGAIHIPKPKQYATKNGKKKYMIQGHIGIDPITKKRKQITLQGFDSKFDAEQAFHDKIRNFRNHNFTDTKNITYEQCYTKWIETQTKKLKSTSIKSKNSKFKKHILPFFRNKKMKDITVDQCQTFINNLSDTLKSFNDIKIQANMVFKYALKWCGYNV